MMMISFNARTPKRTNIKPDRKKLMLPLSVYLSKYQFSIGTVFEVLNLNPNIYMSSISLQFVTVSQGRDVVWTIYIGILLWLVCLNFIIGQIGEENWDTKINVSICSAKIFEILRNNWLFVEHMAKIRTNKTLDTVEKTMLI